MRAYLNCLKDPRMRKVLLGMVILLWLSAMSIPIAPASANSGYDGQSPTQTGCSEGKLPIGGTSYIEVNSFSGTIQFYDSSRCPYAIWGEMAVSSGEGDQYRVKIELTRANPPGSSYFQELANSSLLQGNMLSDEGSCIQATVRISTVSEETTSTIGEEFCRQTAASSGSTGSTTVSSTQTSSTTSVGSSTQGGTTTTTTSGSVQVTTTSNSSTGSQPVIHKKLVFVCRRVHHKMRCVRKHRRSRKAQRQTRAHT